MAEFSIAHPLLDTAKLIVCIPKRYGQANALMQSAKYFLDKGAVIRNIEYYNTGNTFRLGSATHVKVDANLFNTKSDKMEQIFYIPSERHMVVDPASLSFLKPSDFSSETPLLLKEFARHLSTFSLDQFNLDKLEQHTSDALWRKIAHSYPDIKSTPLVGQSFALLLFGVYVALSSENKYKSIFIEDIERGSPPFSRDEILMLVFDLISLGYQVVLSTKSPDFIDAISIIQTIRAHGEGAKYLSQAFKIPEDCRLISACMNRENNIKVLTFEDNTGLPKDISSLDPDSEDRDVRYFGGLVSYSEMICKIGGITR